MRTEAGSYSKAKKTVTAMQSSVPAYLSANKEKLEKKKVVADRKSRFAKKTVLVLPQAEPGKKGSEPDKDSRSSTSQGLKRRRNVAVLPSQNNKNKRRK